MRSPLSWLRGLTTFILLALVFVPFSQVVSRNLLSLPFVGSEELSRFVLICLVFLGYPLVVAGDENIVMAELRAALPRPLALALGGLIHLGAIGVSGLLAYAAYVTIMRNLGNTTPTLKLPFWIFLSAAGLAFLGALIIHLVHLRRKRAPETTVVS